MTINELSQNVTRDILPVVLQINETDKYHSTIQIGKTIYICVYTEKDNHLIFFHNLSINLNNSLECTEIGVRRYGDLTYEQITEKLKERFL